jgi:hypothetical protein
MQLWHDPLKISASFDDPNLVSRAGLVPVMSLAERAGLAGLIRRHVEISAKTGVYPEVKIGCLVAGMAAGADSIDDMDLLRHGAMPDLFAGIRAPSTLGSFLRAFSFGNVRQLEKVNRELLAGPARRTGLLPGADQLAFIDVDSMQRRVYGHKKQGAAFGHTKIQGKTVLVRGLNALAATICTPQAAPVIAATRLRGGSANTARGAASLLAGAVGTARAAGCTGTIVARMDSGYYTAAVCQAARRAGAYFSVTARMDAAVKTAIASIPGDAWTPIKYPNAIWDDQLRAWVSDAEVAEIPYTAFVPEPRHARSVTREGDDAADGPACERPVGCDRFQEHRSVARRWPAVAEVAGQCLAHVCGQGQAVDASPLAPDAQLSCPPVDVVEGQRCNLAGAQPEPREHDQDRHVPAAGDRRRVTACNQPRHNSGGYGSRQRRPGPRRHRRHGLDERAARPPGRVEEAQ